MSINRGMINERYHSATPGYYTAVTMTESQLHTTGRNVGDTI